jgi:hypothetical protein
MTLLVLVFAHLLADYPLQGEFLSKMKGQRALLMITHCGIWTGCIAIAAHLVGLRIDAFDVVFLFVVHWLADTAKARGWYRNADPLGWPLWADQGIHLVQLLVLYVSFK